MSPLAQHMIHSVEYAYPHLKGCAWIVILLSTWCVLSLLLYTLTKWTEWFMGFIGAALFLIPFLFEAAK